MSKRLYTIKSKRWYGRFWPPERRKIKLMQLIADHHAPEIEKKVNKAMTDYFVYGIEPKYHEWGSDLLTTDNKPSTGSSDAPKSQSTEERKG